MKIFLSLKSRLAKLLYILKELWYLIKKEKLMFLMPILVVLAIMAFLVYQLGPTLVISFIYAGV